MPLRHVGGLDHVVILVEDLEDAAARWRSFGFTLSPRGTHSAHKGTANHTMMLGPDYIEILGVLVATELNALDRARLAAYGPGVDRAALRSDDAEAGLAAIRALGEAGTGPQSFCRPVTLPDGTVAEAAFRTFDWPEAERADALRLFACQHLTPETVWVPELTRHPNTARRIRRLDCIAQDARAAAEALARRMGLDAEVDGSGAWTVRTGAGRAEIRFLDPEGFGDRYPGADASAPRHAGAAALVVEVDDLDTAAASSPAARRVAERIVIGPEAATGVLLAFEPA